MDWGSEPNAWPPRSSPTQRVGVPAASCSLRRQRCRTSSWRSLRPTTRGSSGLPRATVDPTLAPKFTVHRSRWPACRPRAFQPARVVTAHHPDIPTIHAYQAKAPASSRASGCSFAAARAAAQPMGTSCPFLPTAFRMKTSPPSLLITLRHAKIREVRGGHRGGRHTSRTSSARDSRSCVALPCASQGQNWEAGSIALDA